MDKVYLQITVPYPHYPLSIIASVFTQLICIHDTRLITDISENGF